MGVVLWKDCGGEQAFFIFIEEKDGKSERYAMIFIANSTPPSTLCHVAAAPLFWSRNRIYIYIFGIRFINISPKVEITGICKDTQGDLLESRTCRYPWFPSSIADGVGF